MFGVKLGLATVAASSSRCSARSGRTPRLRSPGAGTSSSAIDRRPDATSAYAVHVAYVRPASAPDRFAALAPRIVGDTAAFDTLVAPRGRDADAAVRSLSGASAARRRSERSTSRTCQLAAHGHAISTAPSRSSACSCSSEYRLQRAREGLSHLLRRPDRPGRRGSRLRAGSARERLRPSRPRGRLPRLLRRRRGRLAQARVAVHELAHVFGAVDRARRRTPAERPRLRLRRPRSHDRRSHR